MNDITKIDKNFAVEAAEEDGLVFRSCQEPPFRVYGLLLPDENTPYFHRMPQQIADSVSKSVGSLAQKCAGGRVRFRTDSKRVAIRCKLFNISRSDHFPLTATAGFDLYDGTDYVKTFRPPVSMEDGYTSEIAFGSAKMRELTINFPLYSGVVSLEIGLEVGATVAEAAPYRITTPVVYYGSSITQGACASRPGTCYQNIITRRLDCDYINLGFSGSAKAEPEIAEYIAGLPMSVFVYDYDHNAPNLEHLQNTHERMFRTVRERNPELPVLMLSKPAWKLNEAWRKRRDVIMQTYLNARAAGDDKVWFIDGGSMLNMFGGDNGTVDGTHPNNLGMMCMAKAIGDALAEIVGE